MLTGSLATALKKKKLFRSELDHKFGFTPFYGIVSSLKIKTVSSTVLTSVGDP
jgi:hypothetical protein